MQACRIPSLNCLAHSWARLREFFRARVMSVYFKSKPPRLRVMNVSIIKGKTLWKENHMNLVRYQNEIQALARGGLRSKFACGDYGGPAFDKSGNSDRPQHDTVWIPDGEVITDSITIESVNGQLVGRTGEDEYIYFFVSGARGNGHNNHKKLLIPTEVELLAGGGEAAHTTGCCNKITTAIFRVPKGTKKVVVGDMYYGKWSHAIFFTLAGNGEWEVRVEPYDRFCALNPDWPGLWTQAGEGGEKLPLPALVQ